MQTNHIEISCPEGQVINPQNVKIKIDGVEVYNVTEFSFVIDNHQGAVTKITMNSSLSISGIASFEEVNLKLQK